MYLEVDGRRVPAREGQTVLEAARAAGIWIPALCWHPLTGKAGRCRACLVEIDGIRGLKEACATVVRDGMVVRNDTPRVQEARRMVVELLLSDDTHHCLSCEASGGCELQDMAYHLGIERPAFHTGAEPRPLDVSSAGIVRDNARCIQCGRCVKACQDVVVNEVLDFAHRGAHAEVVCDDGAPMGVSSCVQCGMCVQVCPVGALTYKERRGQVRSWQTTTAKVTCPYCGVGCQIDADVADNRIVSSNAHTQRWQEQPNKGLLCVKGRFGLGFSHSPERLTTPLVRKDGKLEPASWDEALDHVAARLGVIRDQSGPDSIGFFASAKISNEDNFILSRFARAVIGTNNLDHCARL